MNENIFELLRIDNTISVNRKIAHAIGLDAAIVYGALLAKYFWYKERKMLDDEGMFFCTMDDLFESTTLQRKKQDKAISILKDHGLIETKRKGIPSKRYFKLNLDINIISKILTKNDENVDSDRLSERDNLDCSVKKARDNTSLSERDNLECTNETNSNGQMGQLNIYNKTNANKTNKNILSKKERKEDEEVKEDKKKTMTLKDKNHSQSENNIKIETIKNCNSNYTTSKSKNQETHEEIIRKFTKDEELIDLLIEYVKMRYLHNNKKALTNRQLEVLLTKLVNLSEKEDEQKAIVTNALMGGYKRFFGLDDKEQGKPAKNMPERHKTANGSEIKPYDLTQRQLEYVKELYEKQERDQGSLYESSGSNSSSVKRPRLNKQDLFYNWLEE